MELAMRANDGESIRRAIPHAGLPAENGFRHWERGACGRLHVAFNVRDLLDFVR